MPRNLEYACAAMTCLAGHKAAGLAMLLSHDCWLRIGEFSAVCVRDVADTRAQADPVGLLRSEQLGAAGFAAGSRGFWR